ncbi:MAG TPA: hypothetical protein VF615_28560 [Longimicrobiaceae bacterium]
MDILWHAVRHLRSGGDPYGPGGPGPGYEGDFPMYYPGTALAAFLPLALLPLEAARLVFACGGAFLLAYAATREGWFRLPMFLSGAFLHAVLAVQWSPLLTAAWLVPGWAWLAASKPNLGAVLLSATPSWRIWRSTFAGGFFLLGASLVLDPAWPVKWLALLRGAPHFIPPVLLPGGFLLLAALLRWRRPEARLLVALGCIPHTTVAYEALPLLLVARNWRESWLLCGLSLSVFFLQIASDTRVAGAPTPERIAAFAELAERTGMLSVALLYLPATLLVLRRPNEGPAPAWAAWLAGRLSAAATTGLGRAGVAAEPRDS